jgi:hypothetical protein
LIRVKARRAQIGDHGPVNASTPVLPARPGWFSLVRPREHGSWSLALEPMALGLLVAPSGPGLLLAAAVMGAFLARRPLRLWWEGGAESDPAGDALLGCAELALGAALLASWLGGTGWLVWLLPTAVLGGIFLWLDLRREGRSAPAELAGAAAFACLPAVLARLAGFTPAAALALGAVSLARNVPTVLYVRARVRAHKVAPVSPAPGVAAAGIACTSTAVLVRLDLAPATALVLTGLLLARAILLLSPAGAAPTARTIGIIEAALGLLFVVLLALTWGRP